LSLLKLNSAKSGSSEIKTFLDECEEELVSDRSDHVHLDIFKTVVEKAINIDVSENDISLIIYIPGYIGRKIEFKVGCSLCLNLILTNRNLEIDTFSGNLQYLNCLDRGALKYPTEFLVSLLQEAYIIILISKDYEKYFLFDTVRI
jgi:hypothetical protein